MLYLYIDAIRATAGRARSRILYGHLTNQPNEICRSYSTDEVEQLRFGYDASTEICFALFRVPL